MMIQYIGERNKYNPGHRGGECQGNPYLEPHQEAEEQRKMDYVADKLKELGWEVTEGIPLWFFVNVEDRNEYNELVADYKKIKREYKK